MKQVLSIGWKRLSSIGKDDSGAALVITLAVFFFLFIMVSSVYTMGTAVHRRIELQNACDAAAYSAAVVQADGLSRMAVVNRAMSWTYVQMVRRQMDYITYRWLRLTHKQFKEDAKKVKSYHFCLFGDLCDKDHNKEGKGYWCGLNGNKVNKVRLNMHGEGDAVDVDDLEDLLDDLKDKMGDKEDGSVSSGGGAEEEDDDDLFEGNLMKMDPVQEQLMELYQQYGKSKSDEEIFTIWYQMNGGKEEPEKYVTNSITGIKGINPEWVKWDILRKNFVDEHNKKIGDPDVSNMKCKVCGRPPVDVKTGEVFDHSPCMEKHSSSGQSKNSSGQCSICKAPAKGGTHENCGWAAGLAEQIQNDKSTIEMLNTALTAINLNMVLGMKEAAREMLEYNLPKDADGEISKDFYYTLHIPTGSDPYGQEGGDASMSGIYSPLYNTEEHETIFLNMADGDNPGSLPSYFVETSGNFMDKISGGLNSLLGGGVKSKGLDQWFIRTYPDESRDDGSVVIKPTGESYHAEGICRCYKNANRDEGRSGILGKHRPNHILDVDTGMSVGSGDILGLSSIIEGLFTALKDLLDISPSCQNRRERFPDMCGEVDDSVALVSQYRWASAMWFCWPQIYIFGVKWHHPFFPLLGCSKHGYGSFLSWLGPELSMIGKDGLTRSEYRNCFMGVDSTFVVKGHARIYGDDRRLFNEQYVGTPARPWLLNEKFFSGDGTITVAVARRQRNPWQALLGWLDSRDKTTPNLSGGLMSVFNVNRNNYAWTASTARAAYRRRNDSNGELAYDVKFDESAWPDKLTIHYGKEATADMKRLRVGCVCDDEDNVKRLESSWNLCTTDWEATLLPVRYSRGHIGRYESWRGHGGADWTETASNDTGVFQMLEGQKWNCLNEDGKALPGSAVMRSGNINGAELGGSNLKELEKLKIY